MVRTPKCIMLLWKKAGWFEPFLDILVSLLQAKHPVRVFERLSFAHLTKLLNIHIPLVSHFVPFVPVDGTHPHQWSPRKNFNMYPFQSSSAPQALPLVPESTGVEHYITHNGDFEFYKFGNGKFYDTSEVQQFLVKALGVPMPATVDSAAVAGVIDLLRCQGSWALSLRYAVCFATDNVDPADKMADYPTTGEYIEVGTVFENSLSDFVVNHQIKCIEDISSSIENRSKLVDCLIGPFSTYLTSAKTSRINDFVSSDEENGGLLRFMEAVVNAFFDNDLLHTTRTFLNNAKGSFGLSISSSLDAHRQGKHLLYFCSSF